MACSTCKKVKQETLSATADGLEYSLRPDTFSIAATGSVVRPPAQPRGGWHVRWKIKGQDTVVPGISPAAVHKSTKALFATNGISVSDKDLWLNLNIQWAQRTVEKHLLVNLPGLLSLADVSDPVEESPHNTPRWEARQWVQLAWNGPLIYLSRSTYQYSEFLLLLELLFAGLYDSSTLGNPRGYSAFVIALSDLKKSPVYQQNEARVKAVEMMNKIFESLGVEICPYNDVATKYHWS